MIPFVQGVWNNRGWNRTGLYALDTKDFPVVVGPSGHKFYVTDDLFTVAQAWHDYDFSDIRGTDVVIDIGANIGGFTIPAAQKAEYVCAIEPIRSHDLWRNIDLNDISRENIDVWPVSLGKENDVPVLITWRGSVSSPYSKTFSRIKTFCDNEFTFLKCDCEGAERYIKTEELDGIRRIEMEFHKPYADELFDYITKNWETKVDKRRDTMIVHAREK